MTPKAPTPKAPKSPKSPTRAPKSPKASKSSRSSRSSKSSRSPRRTSQKSSDKPVLRKDGLPLKSTREAFVTSPAAPTSRRPGRGDPSHCEIDSTHATTGLEVRVDIEGLLDEFVGAAGDLRGVVSDIQNRFLKTSKLTRYAMGRFRSALRVVNAIHDRLVILMESGAPVESPSYGEVDMSGIAGTKNTSPPSS